MILYIEDLIFKFAEKNIGNQFENSFMNSISVQLDQRQELTEKQAALAVKILKKHQTLLEDTIGVNVDSINNPKFKHPFRQIKRHLISIVERELSSILPAGKYIKIEFPFNEELINNIKSTKFDLKIYKWSNADKAWFFNLNETTIELVKNLFKHEQFEYDAEFKNYSDQFDNIVSNIESHAPVLSLKNGIPVYQNPPEYLPSLTSTDILTSIFEARKSGITLYDDAVQSFLENDLKDPVTVELLKSNTADHIVINSSEYGFSNFKNIIKHLQPCLFVLPPTRELESLKKIHDVIKSEGYNIDSCSVMFRLPNTESDFNEFVKSNKLNNPITESTKFVFVSHKIPKPVLQSNIEFQTAIVLANVNAHYTVRDMLIDQPNIIYYLNEKEIKRKESLRTWERVR
jgi:hypothetical protein